MFPRLFFTCLEFQLWLGMIQRNFLFLFGIMWWSLITQPLQQLHCVLFRGMLFCFWPYIHAIPWAGCWELVPGSLHSLGAQLVGGRTLKARFWGQLITCSTTSGKSTPTFLSGFESDWREEIEILSFLIWLLLDKCTYHTYLKDESYLVEVRPSALKETPVPWGSKG